MFIVKFYFIGRVCLSVSHSYIECLGPLYVYVCRIHLMFNC